MPRNVVPPKSSSILDVFKKKKTHQEQGQPVLPNEDLDQLQGDEFPLSEPIADTDNKAKHDVSNNDNNDIYDIIFLISWYMASWLDNKAYLLRIRTPLHDLNITLPQVHLIPVK